MYHSFLIHSSADGHLGCFHALNFPYGSTLTSIRDHSKTTALTRWAFVSKVSSLIFNMLSRLVIAFLPRASEQVKQQ